MVKYRLFYPVAERYIITPHRLLEVPWEGLRLSVPNCLDTTKPNAASKTVLQKNGFYCANALIDDTVY